MPSVSSAIRATIIYADIFDYPLTEEEVWKKLVRCPGVSRLQCRKALSKIKDIQEKDGLYFLKGRKEIVNIRKKREKHSMGKLKIAQKASGLLEHIPTIKLVGISGALAINNADKNDDIDFYVISSADFLWTTRFFATLMMELAGLRRRRNKGNAKDKICLNMFTDEKHLAVPESERDIFSAHEVVQMKPLYDRDKTHDRFLIANSWTGKYLSNAPHGNKNILATGKRTDRKKTTSNFLEKMLRILQLYYMKNHRTEEIITKGFIRFHPKDARKWILEKYYSGARRYRAVYK